MDVALGGALLVELALAERVGVAGPGERVRAGRLVLEDPAPTGDLLLDDALAVVRDREGKRPQDVVARLGKRARARVYGRLVERGVLRAEGHRVLGVLPTHRWPSRDATHEASVRAELVTALRAGATTEARTGALVSLLLALDAVRTTVDPGSVGLTRKELDANARRIAEGDWAGRAVGHAIDAMNAAVIAAVSTSVVAGGT